MAASIRNENAEQQESDENVDEQESHESDSDGDNGDNNRARHDPKKILQLVAKLNGMSIAQVQGRLKVMIACDEVYVRGSFVYSTHTDQFVGVL